MGTESTLAEGAAKDCFEDMILTFQQSDGRRRELRCLSQVSRFARSIILPKLWRSVYVDKLRILAEVSDVIESDPPRGSLVKDFRWDWDLVDMEQQCADSKYGTPLECAFGTAQLE